MIIFRMRIAQEYLFFCMFTPTRQRVDVSGEYYGKQQNLKPDFVYKKS